VIFLSKEGKIVRYLNGVRFNPADLELAVVDASEGRARSFMQRMQRLCYSYDPAGRAYVLKTNRIILGVTLLFAGLFGVFLFSKNLTRKNPKSHATGSAS
jgi:protein SCO1/2